MAVVGVLAGTVTLLGCPAVNNNEVPNVVLTFPLDTTNANDNNTAVLNGKTFTVPGDTLAAVASTPALAAALSGQTPALSFADVSGANGNVTLTNPTASGTVQFASCLFTIRAPANLVGTIFVQNCSVDIAGHAAVPGASVNFGTMTMTFNGTKSSGVQTTLQLTPTNKLIVGGVQTTFTLTQVTGSSGGSL
jgi:hypothetical protein